MGQITILAIDPGASGGMATYSKDEGVRLYPFPEAITDFVTFVNSIDGPTYAFVEEPPLFVSGMSTSPSSMGKLHRNVGYIIGVLDALLVPTKLIKPRVWQAKVGAGSKKDYGDRWKAHLKDLAARRFPSLGKSITLKTADALLILSYAIETNGVKS